MMEKDGDKRVKTKDMLKQICTKFGYQDWSETLSRIDNNRQ
jgi:hypothetical protein